MGEPGPVLHRAWGPSVLSLLPQPACIRSAWRPRSDLQQQHGVVRPADAHRRRLGCQLGERPGVADGLDAQARSEEHTSELQSRFGISYAVFCLKKKKK